MTVADLLMCIVYMKTRPWLSHFNLWLCHPYYVIIWTCQMCSCLNLVWYDFWKMVSWKSSFYFRLNVDKLIYIQFPLHYYQIVNRKRLLWITAATWGGLYAMNIALVTFLKITRVSYFYCKTKHLITTNGVLKRKKIRYWNKIQQCHKFER